MEEDPEAKQRRLKEEAELAAQRAQEQKLLEEKRQQNEEARKAVSSIFSWLRISLLIVSFVALASSGVSTTG